MARRHGRNSRVYMNLTSAGTAEPIAYIKGSDFGASTDKTDVTAMGDTNKIYVAGLPDATGKFDFWYDDATVQTYTAAVDGVARKMYIYPDIVNAPAQYFFGTAFPDFQISTAVDGAIDGTASWNAAGTWSKVG